MHIGGTVHGQGNVEHKHPDADGETEEEVVTFADVAIPEVHITRYKELSDMIHSLRKKTPRESGVFHAGRKDPAYIAGIYKAAYNV